MGCWSMQLQQDVNLPVWSVTVPYVRQVSTNIVSLVMKVSTSMLEEQNAHNVQSLIALLVRLLLALPAKVVTNYQLMDNHVQK